MRGPITRPYGSRPHYEALCALRPHYEALRSEATLRGPIARLYGARSHYEAKFHCGVMLFVCVCVCKDSNIHHMFGFGLSQRCRFKLQSLVVDLLLFSQWGFSKQRSTRRRFHGGRNFEQDQFRNELFQFCFEKIATFVVFCHTIAGYEEASIEEAGFGLGYCCLEEASSEEASEKAQRKESE